VRQPARSRLFRLRRFCKGTAGPCPYRDESNDNVPVRLIILMTMVGIRISRGLTLLLGVWGEEKLSTPQAELKPGQHLLDRDPKNSAILILQTEGFLLPGTRFFIAPLLRMTLARNLSFRESRTAATEKSLEPGIHCEIQQSLDKI